MTRRSKMKLSRRRLTISLVSLVAGFFSALGIDKKHGLATPVCYVTTEDGETTNLTSLCGTSTESIESVNSSEALTKAAYARSRSGYDYMGGNQFEDALAEFEESRRLHLEAGHPERAEALDDFLEFIRRVILERQ